MHAGRDGASYDALRGSAAVPRGFRVRRDGSTPEDLPGVAAGVAARSVGASALPRMEALMSAPTVNPEKWRGPYLSKKIPLDPWGNPYTYRNPGTNAEFDVISLGADGKPGGTGDNADLTN